MPRERYTIERASNGYLLQRRGEQPTFYETLGELFRAQRAMLGDDAGDPVALAAKVASGVMEGLGGRQVAPDTWVAPAGSSMVTVAVVDPDGAPPMLHVWAPVIKVAQVADTLARELLEANARASLGSFAVVMADEQPMVVFREQLLASTITAEELTAAVVAVASTADQMDDRLVERFGGTTAIGEAVEQPPPQESTPGYL